jgi:hypothetical protein
MKRLSLISRNFTPLRLNDLYALDIPTAPVWSTNRDIPILRHRTGRAFMCGIVRMDNGAGVMLGFYSITNLDKEL